MINQVLWEEMGRTYVEVLLESVIVEVGVEAEAVVVVVIVALVDELVVAALH